MKPTTELKQAVRKYREGKTEVFTWLYEESSAKAKVTAGIIGVGTVAVVGSAVYVALQEKAETWEKEYRKILLEDDKAVGFDLNDFEEDGIPELVVLKEDGGVELYNCGMGAKLFREVQKRELIEGSGDSVSIEHTFGYDMDYDTMLDMKEVFVDLGDGRTEYAVMPVYMQYVNGWMKDRGMTSFGNSNGIYPVMWFYYWDDGNDTERNEISEEEAREHITEAGVRFNEIEYTDITEKAIQERFEEFKENGNRKRYRNSSAETAVHPENETVGNVETSVNETIITLSDGEMDSIEMLISLTALSDYFLGNRMTGAFHDFSDMETNMRFIEMASCFGVDYDIYAGYLPPMEVDKSTFTRCFAEDDIQSYLKNVFSIEDVDLSPYLENGKIVCSLIGDPIPTEVNVGRVTALDDGTCKISGTVSVIEEGSDWEPYPFLMTVISNSNSPFGFTVKNLHYGSKGSISLEDRQSELILQMALAAEHACISHWHMTEDFDIYPEEMNILSKYEYAAEGFRLGWTGDGKDTATAEELAELYYQVTGEQFSREELDNIFDGMQAEGSSYLYKGTDYEDGTANLYVQLDAFYDSGIYSRYDIEKDRYTYDNRIISYSSDGKWVMKENNVERFYDDYIAMSGVSIAYDVPFTIFLYVDSNSPTGYRLHYIHYYVSKSSVLGASDDTYIYEQIGISAPYGRYKSNRGFELEFFDNNTVRVSEGNSNKKCAFTIDESGKLIIDPDGEAVEGTYDALADEIMIYSIKFRK